MYDTRTRHKGWSSHSKVLCVMNEALVCVLVSWKYMQMHLPVCFCMQTTGLKHHSCVFGKMHEYVPGVSQCVCKEYVHYSIFSLLNQGLVYLSRFVYTVFLKMYSRDFFCPLYWSSQLFGSCIQCLDILGFIFYPNTWGHVYRGC